MEITEANCVYFDLNTKKDDHYDITQVGAVHAGSASCFNESPNSKTSIATVLVNFFAWLNTVNNGNPVVLIAHNAKRFDKKVLETVAQDEMDFNGWKGLLQYHRIPIPAGVVACYCDYCIPKELSTTRGILNGQLG